jgi:hypothetical protein
VAPKVAISFILCLSLLYVMYMSFSLGKIATAYATEMLYDISHP